MPSNSIRNTAEAATIASPEWILYQRRRRWRNRLVVLILLTCCVGVFATLTGSVSLKIRDLLAVLGGHGLDTHHTIVWELRLPRIAAAALVGAALALAGVQMQVLIRNPLADPYVLGISGGAAVGALIAIILDLGGRSVELSAAFGALISMSFVLILGRGPGPWSSTRLLLTGVVVSAGWGAVIGFLLAVGPTTKLRGMLFWLMGDFSNARPGLWLLIVVVIGFILSMLLAHSMNILALGRMQARVLGLEVDRLRLALYLIASVLTALAVTVAGSIGFVGLVVPHLMRLIGGTDHRWVVPSSCIAGAGLLVLADTLARSILAPQQLPVGVLTAFAGVPVFLFLLWRGMK